MLTTNDEALWGKAWSFKDHGKSYDAVYKRRHPPGFGFRWLHDSFGTNWRMTEMQAAIGRRQLMKLPDWLKSRGRHAAHLAECCDHIPGLRVTVPPDHVGHAWYKYYAFLRPERLAPGWDKDRIMNAINAEGVYCVSGSCSEIYLEKAFNQEVNRPTQRLPVARELGETSLMFLVHPTIAEADLLDTCLAVEKVFAVAAQ
jgi:dTDP-4-amino-4,6-dideoxygalactose transaminase